MHVYSSPLGQYSVRVKKAVSKVKSKSLKLALPLSGQGSWASHLISPSLCFLICKTGKKERKKKDMLPASIGVSSESNEIMHVKHVEYLSPPHSHLSSLQP